MTKDAILSPLGWLYGKIMDARRRLYEKGSYESFALGARTISIGNLTVGGTGKTPLVEYLAKILLEKGEKVCILTRGYGRDNPKERVLVSNGEMVLADFKEAGDEPFELANKLEGKAIIVADAKRAEAGKWAKEEFGITTFILDDGFQHLRLKRNLDIVLLDATNPFGNGKILPAGTLRESVTGLGRADVVIITRTNLVEETAKLKEQVEHLNPRCRIFVSRNKFSRLIKLKEFFANEKNSPAAEVKKLKSFAFCALGNPENFFNQLRREKYNLISVEKFPDHHVYTQNEIRNLEKAAVENGAEILLTTAKDAVKLTHLKFNLPCFVMENGLTIEDESALINLIFQN